MLQGVYTSLSALNANQRALDVTSHNIGNAETEGYTKQRVNFTPNPTKDTPNASMTIHMGTGTHIQSVERVEDKFLYSRLNEAKRDFTRNKEQYNSLKEVDNTLQNSTFTDMYDMMFESLHRYTEMPHNMELQYLAEENAKALTKKAEQMQEVFNNVRAKNQEKMEALEKELPDMRLNVEELEKEIKVREAMNEHNTDKTYANDLRDRRDLLQTQIEVKESSINGLNKSNETLSNIQKLFKDSFDETYEAVQEYLDSPQSGSDANNLLAKEAEIRGNHKKPFVHLKDTTETSGFLMGSTEVIMQTLQNKDDNVSKVNLDEEMVNLMKYQKAYEANAKVMQTYDELLETTLGIKR